jgi:hypothetical protein
MNKNVLTALTLATGLMLNACGVIPCCDEEKRAVKNFERDLVEFQIANGISAEDFLDMVNGVIETFDRNSKIVLEEYKSENLLEGRNHKPGKRRAFEVANIATFAKVERDMEINQEVGKDDVYVTESAENYLRNALRQYSKQKGILVMNGVMDENFGLLREKANAVYESGIVDNRNIRQRERNTVDNALAKMVASDLEM